MFPENQIPSYPINVFFSPPPPPPLTYLSLALNPRSLRRQQSKADAQQQRLSSIRKKCEFVAGRTNERHLHPGGDDDATERTMVHDCRPCNKLRLDERERTFDASMRVVNANDVILFPDDLRLSKAVVRLLCWTAVLAVSATKASLLLTAHRAWLGTALVFRRSSSILLLLVQHQVAKGALRI